MRAVVSCPGTCGELFQGWIEGHKCLISCPVSLYSILEIEVRQGDGVFFLPDDMEKTGSALKLASDLWGLKDINVRVKRIESLSQSRGYASSTSDILCALYGLAICTRKELSPQEATRIAIMIEPSDGLAWKNLTLLNHVKGLFHLEISAVPPLSLLLLDPGGSVDTVNFNAQRRDHLSFDYVPVLSDLKKALEDSNWSKLGEATTASALANQSILFKPYLERLVDSTERAGGLGVVTAHSGTISGVLLPVEKSSLVAESILKDMNWSENWAKVSLVPGGVRILEVFE